MVFIDGTVVNVALPALQKDLNAGISDVQWVVEAYALFLAALLLAGGAAGDRFGRRRVFSIGVALFAMASVWCGIAASARQLILARAVQGIGGALLVPGSLAIIGASFDERGRGKAIGTWSGATAITAAIGPVLGGWLIDHLSWRAAFLINVPLAALVLVLTSWRVPESHQAGTPANPDWIGALLVTVGLGAVVFSFIESSGSGWSDPGIQFALVLGVCALAAFAFVEARQSAPMVTLSLFSSRNFSGANLLTFLLYAALGGGLFFLPLNLIQVHGYSATAAGAALLPLVLLISVLSRWSGGLVDRYGARMPLVVGPLVAAVGFALLAVPSTGGSYWFTFFPAVVVLGLGMALSVAPLTTTVMNSVESGFSGIASGINNAASRVAALLAVALFGMVIAPVFNHRLDRYLERAEISPAVVQAVEQQRGKLAAIALPPGADADDEAAIRIAIANAFVAGFRWVMLLSSLLALASAAVAWLLIGRARHPLLREN